MFSTTPIYNLKVVLKETGLAADTLRAWERRYGLPTPQRTQGGHRLYSEHDIETIKWLVKRQAEGLSISRAVDLWNEKLTSGAEPLADSISAISAKQAVITNPDTKLDSLRATWMNACMDFNELAAEQTLNQAFSLFPMEAVCTEILQKGLSEIGEHWYENKASVQQEHFASALAMRRLDTLLSATPQPTQNKTVLVGCPPGEWHTFTPLLLTLLLRRRGVNVIYLGANVPAEKFAETVKVAKADLIILVAQQLITAATLERTALSLSANKTPVAFGGRIFNLNAGLIQHIAGHFLGKDLIHAVDGVETLLTNRLKVRALKAASQIYITANQAYQSKRTEIELTLRQALAAFPIATEDIKTGMHFLGENISAALQLGDMSYVSAEVNWLKALLRSHDTPPEQLIHFLGSYSNALKRHINGQGKLITDWFKTELEKLNA